MQVKLESANQIIKKDDKIIETMNKDKNEFAKSNHDVLKILNTLCQATGSLEPMTEADCRLYLGNDDED